MLILKIILVIIILCDLYFIKLDFINQEANPNFKKKIIIIKICVILFASSFFM